MTGSWWNLAPGGLPVAEWDGLSSQVCDSRPGQWVSQGPTQAGRCQFHPLVAGPWLARRPEVLK